LLAWLGGGPLLVIRRPSRLLLLGLRSRLSLSLSICLRRRLLALLSLLLRIGLLVWLSRLLVANLRLSFSLSELHPRLSGLLVLHPRLPLLLHLSRLLLRLSDVHPRLWLLDLDLRRRRRNINLRLRHANDYLRLRLLDRDCGRRLTYHDLRHRLPHAHLRRLLLNLNLCLPGFLSARLSRGLSYVVASFRQPLNRFATGLLIVSLLILPSLLQSNRKLSLLLLLGALWWLPFSTGSGALVLLQELDKLDAIVLSCLLWLLGLGRKGCGHERRRADERGHCCEFH
jgi:hypothetical protein